MKGKKIGSKKRDVAQRGMHSKKDKIGDWK
jgi:hypothetical protein